MTPEKLLQSEHEALRTLCSSLTESLKLETPILASKLAALKDAVQTHFRKEESFYQRIDAGKKIQDRGLMHTLRNDHAAVLFTLESLNIRLRKSGCTPEWESRLNAMLNVLLPHLDHEEAKLFPHAAAMSPQDQESLMKEMNSRG